MRIWLVNHYAIPPSQPGGTRHHALARELIHRGHDVTVIASSFNHATGTHISCTNGKMCTFEEIGGVPFLFLRVPAYRGKMARLWNMCVFAFEVWLGLGTRSLSKPDIVIGSSLTLFAALAAAKSARRLHVPFVLEIRDLWPQTLIDMGMSANHPAVLGFGMIEKYLYRNSDKIVTLLPNASEFMASKGARPNDIIWIPNGVDVKQMPPSSIPESHEAFTVMYAGSHGLSDALDSVLDAAAILNKRAPGRFCFQFSGDGPKKEELRRRSRTEEITNVVFDDPVPKHEMLAKMQEADAFIIAMKRTDLYRYGISPNKLHEYMAAARPTIFAGTSHNNPIAEAGAGITVGPEDPMAIAAAVEDLAALSIDDRRDMGLRARQYIEERHDFVVLGGQLERVLQSAFVSHGKAGCRTLNADAEDTPIVGVKSVSIK